MSVVFITRVEIVTLLIVGDVPKTSDPEPVSSVIAVAKLADDGVARKVAMPVPNPEIPEDTGNPVQFVSVPEDGVPRAPDAVRTEAPPAVKEPVTDSAPANEAVVAEDDPAATVRTAVPSLFLIETPEEVDVGLIVSVSGVTNVGDVIEAEVART